MRDFPWQAPDYVLVCCAEREGGIPACGRKGREMLLAMQNAVDKHGLVNELQVTATACLGGCAMEPAVVSYPRTRMMWVAANNLDANSILNRIQSSRRALDGDVPQSEDKPHVAEEPPPFIE